MASVKGEIDRIATAKSDIESAIEYCGVNVPNTALISTYADYVRAIPAAVFSQFNLEEVGGTDMYIKSISQTNGVISASAGGVFTKSGSSASVGLVPKPPTSTGTSKFLCEDASWAIPPYPTTFTWTAGSTSGPTGSLTGNGMGAVSFAAIPAASTNASGIVTTGVQTFTGAKTFNTQLLMQGTAHINFGGEFSYIYGGSSYLQINGYKSTYFSIGGSDKLKLTDSALHPAPSSKLTLGTVIYKFGDVYATSIGTSASRCTYGYFSQMVHATNGFYEDSDERLKQILEPIKINLNDLSKLRKIYYLWKDNPEQGKQLGVIAQDIQKLYPELVDEDTETGLLSVAYDKLSVVALAAVDKLQEEIGSLQKKHIELEDRISKLENLLLYGKEQ